MVFATQRNNLFGANNTTRTLRCVFRIYLYRAEEPTRRVDIDRRSDYILNSILLYVLNRLVSDSLLFSSITLASAQVQAAEFLTLTQHLANRLNTKGVQANPTPQWSEELSGFLMKVIMLYNTLKNSQLKSDFALS